MDISSEIAAVYQRALLLRQRATELPVQPHLVEEALRELLFVLEELQTSQEELRLQNQELIAARHGVELERRNYQALFELAPNGYLVTNRQGKIYQANRAAGRLFSIPQTYLINKPLLVFIDESDQQIFQSLLLGLNQTQDWEVTVKKGNEEKRIFAFSITEVKAIGDGEDTLLWMLRDITERKQADAEIHRIAYYDSITNLPNRLLVLEYVQKALALAKRSYCYSALLFMDLDGFKAVNDTCGHNIGDRLLAEVGMRLKQSLRETDTAGRFGGDEFIILLPELSYGLEVATRLSFSVAQKIRTSITIPFLLDEKEVVIGASIGITLFPKGTETVNDLLRKGDIAMYQAKASGGNLVRLFDENMQIPTKSRFSAEAKDS
jgi:diguanylate cyclase (GGDEF)-like protein/PAS domain S-box-containing protein